MAVFREFILMRDAVSQGLSHRALEKPCNVFESHAGFGNHAKGNLMHMRHIIPNLQFGFCSGGFSALDKGAVEKDSTMNASVVWFKVLLFSSAGTSLYTSMLYCA